jgi:hypothetical protein
MIEIHGTTINIYDLKTTNAGSIYSTREVDDENVTRSRKFPFELVDNAYNVYNLFSPNFDYYLDWCHGNNNFMIIETKTNLVMYRFGKNFMHMPQKNIQAV